MMSSRGHTPISDHSMIFKSQYHYHFYPQADSSGYDGCLVSQCSPDVASDIVGVAYDGFPIYGPTQDWLEINLKIKFNNSTR